MLSRAQSDHLLHANTHQGVKLRCVCSAAINLLFGLQGPWSTFHFLAAWWSTINRRTGGTADKPSSKFLSTNDLLIGPTMLGPMSARHHRRLSPRQNDQTEPYVLFLTRDHTTPSIHLALLRHLGDKGGKASAPYERSLLTWTDHDLTRNGTWRWAMKLVMVLLALSVKGPLCRIAPLLQHVYKMSSITSCSMWKINNLLKWIIMVINPHRGIVSSYITYSKT